jgi:hypothetical protein
MLSTKQAKIFHRFTFPCLYAWALKSGANASPRGFPKVTDWSLCVSNAKGDHIARQISFRLVTEVKAHPPSSWLYFQLDFSTSLPRSSTFNTSWTRLCLALFSALQRDSAGQNNISKENPLQGNDVFLLKFSFGPSDGHPQDIHKIICNWPQQYFYWSFLHTGVSVVGSWLLT